MLISSDFLEKKFARQSALVVGDVMVDHYIFGLASRISPEAPVPIVNVEKRDSRPGGAANVAMNISSLGAEVRICSVTGNDHWGNILIDLIHRQGLPVDGIIRSAKRITTVKTRIFSRGHQLLRYDEETDSDLSQAEEEELLTQALSAIESSRISVVILQDYNKGVLTDKVIRQIIQTCKRKNIPVAVDPKNKRFFCYRHVTLFKPNLKEVAEALATSIDKHDISGLRQAARAIHKRLQNAITLITLSEEGLFITDHEKDFTLPPTLRQVADVSGAGDTVLGVAALALAAGFDIRTIGVLSNIAGGLACEQVGVSPLDKSTFFSEASRVKLV
ncbi:MAG: carbohydrate kinase [Chitinophagales bacterium]|nr:MAG: carbohydrate kinase [Chitinophagales bacterium]